MDHEARKVAQERGKRLREARTKAELTQCELAKKLSVAYNTVSSWERGVNGIPKSIKRTLNYALGLPEASTWVFDGVETAERRLEEDGTWVIEGSFRLVVKRASTGAQ